MSEKILFVDDEVHILDSMKRQLRKRFNVVTAESGKEALEKFIDDGPYSVIVSDMRMPEMDGVELLATVKDRYPDTIRIMLTGNADQATAIDAVNQGQIFKFLNKPCSIPVLVTSLALALRQYRLVTAEKELLDKTLKGSVKVLSELLSFANPTAFSGGLRIRSLVVSIAEALSIDRLWQLEIAALMSQIGCVTLPNEIITKLYSNLDLNQNEMEMYFRHPQAGAQLLENIPRLEGVAQIIRNQLKDFDEYDPDDTDNEETNLSTQVIRVIFDYDLLLFQGTSHTDAIKRLRKQKNIYNPEVIKQLNKLKLTEGVSQVVNLMIKDLTIGMVAEDNIIAKNDTLLVPKGQEITKPVLQGLQNFSRQVGVIEPVRMKTLPQMDA